MLDSWAAPCFWSRGMSVRLESKQELSRSLAEAETLLLWHGCNTQRGDKGRENQMHRPHGESTPLLSR